MTGIWWPVEHRVTVCPCSPLVNLDHGGDDNDDGGNDDDDDDDNDDDDDDDNYDDGDDNDQEKLYHLANA